MFDFCKIWTRSLIGRVFLIVGFSLSSFSKCVMCCFGQVSYFLVLFWIFKSICLCFLVILGDFGTEIHLDLKSRYRDFPSGPLVKNLPGNVGDRGSIPGLGRFLMPWGNWAHAPQLQRLHSRACEPQLLKPPCSRACMPQLLRLHATTTKSPCALEPVLCNRRSHCTEQPVHCS